MNAIVGFAQGQDGQNLNTSLWNTSLHDDYPVNFGTAAACYGQNDL